MILALSISVKYYQKYKENKRYEEINSAIADAVKREIAATFVLKDEYNCNNKTESYSTSKYLISQGYLKLEEMKDIDNKNYCTADINKHVGPNCSMEYQIKLKCQNYSNKIETDNY